jgi:hypothetical protein
VDVEWIILADAAEAVNNELYLMGGGWTAITANRPLPTRRPCAAAVAFSVPWDETDRRHSIEIVVEDPGGAVLVSVPGQVEVGVPPGTPIGSAQRVLMAITMVLPLPRLGDYAVVAKVEGREAKRVPFAVVAGPAMTTERRAPDAA